MNIREAKEGDFEEYLKLKREEEKEYSKIIHVNIAPAEEDKLKDEFECCLENSKNILLIAQEETAIAYLLGTIKEDLYHKQGFVDYLFVSRSFRRKGIARELI